MFKEIVEKVAVENIFEGIVVLKPTGAICSSYAVYKNGDVVETKTEIHGKISSSATLQKLVFNKYWNKPYSIFHAYRDEEFADFSAKETALAEAKETLYAAASAAVRKEMDDEYYSWCEEEGNAYNYDDSYSSIYELDDSEWIKYQTEVWPEFFWGEPELDYEKEKEEEDYKYAETCINGGVVDLKEFRKTITVLNTVLRESLIERYVKEEYDLWIYLSSFDKWVEVEKKDYKFHDGKLFIGNIELNHGYNKIWYLTDASLFKN